MNRKDTYDLAGAAALASGAAEVAGADASASVANARLGGALNDGCIGRGGRSVKTQEGSAMAGVGLAALMGGWM